MKFSYFLFVYESFRIVPMPIYKQKKKEKRLTEPFLHK